VKVTFGSRESATSVLVGAKGLKQVDNLKNVFISPDRSPEERAKRRELISQLKEKIKKEPELYHFIQNGKLLSAEKRQSQSTNSSTSNITPKLVTPKQVTPKDTMASYTAFFNEM
jgi:hypothetical protein